MKIADILRSIADVVDMEQQAQQSLALNPATVEIVATDMAPEMEQPEEDCSELELLAKLAGITRASTTPDEQVFPMTAAFPAGNDVHHSKNPADMRSDSVSMYPDWQARKGE